MWTLHARGAKRDSEVWTYDSHNWTHIKSSSKSSLFYMSWIKLCSNFWFLRFWIVQMGLILPRWDLILPRIPPRTLVHYSAVTNPFWGYVCTQNTSNPIPKNLFSCPELESGQNELLSGSTAPQLGKMFEKWTTLFKKWANLFFSFQHSLVILFAQ